MRPTFVPRFFDILHARILARPHVKTPASGSPAGPGPFFLKNTGKRERMHLTKSAGTYILCGFRRSGRNPERFFQPSRIAKRHRQNK